ncbi:phospho-sugar mutase [Candidatus Clostridium radicumherbarum]|uniref:Phosphoglucomutase n=1 Tax=Candidatus Clostridium radicumherbarum TaxID=3381662 RepID=A0ABW8TVQ5_9CLOT
MDYRQKYELWISSKKVDTKTKEELMNITDEKELEDRFYKELEFGTGGLRGIIAAGSNRMNVYTVGKATQGLAHYLLNMYKNDISVSIAYDCRIMSKEFAETAALVLCGNGIKVNLFDALRPTPMLSYAVRLLKSKAGIVITASHNPKIYNGYKVYGEDGGQVTDEAAKEILNYINEVDNFNKIRSISMEEAVKRGYLNIIGEEVDKSYFERVKGLTLRSELVKARAKDLKIIYTPIHGSGNIPVRRVLKELGYENVFVVKEQETPDGTFPTAAYPNPEEPKVFELALKMAEKIKPDIIFGTDPDCDRIGVVVKDNNGEYRVLSGNQTGVLLSNYILNSLKEKDKLSKDGAIIKTIVTSELAARISENYGVEIIDVLTGFKYIGEKIKDFEETNTKDFIFGFEESFGYLAGDFVRDKDAVIASTLISEMALFYKTKNMSLYDALIELYNKYGYYKESLISIELKGKEGQEKIEKALEFLRHSMKSRVNGTKIIKKMDYRLSIEKDLISIKENIINLPKSNVLKFILEDNSWFVVRPSGTEPKMKIYLSCIGQSEEDAEKKLDEFKNSIIEIVNLACSK